MALRSKGAAGRTKGWLLSKQDASSPKKEEVHISKTEEDGCKRIFEILTVHGPDVLLEFEKIIHSSEHDKLCKCFVDLGLATGTTLPMLRIFILEDFQKNSESEQGSVMRGNCLASRLIKLFLQHIGRGYLQQTIGSFLSDLLALEKPMEIDPNKLDPSGVDGTVESNKAMLTEKVRAILQHVTSEEAIAKMPPEIRMLASYFAEFASTYAPDQFYSLVGGFLFLRYINPGFTTPEVYGLLPQGYAPTPIARRNLILVSKILQNLSNGIEFGQKEPFMMCMNDFLKANMWKMENYFRAVVTSSGARVPRTLDPSAVAQEDILWFHHALSNNVDKLLEELEDDAIYNELMDILDKLGQYRHIETFLNRKYSVDHSATLRLVIETNGEFYEQTLDGSVSVLQPLVQSLQNKIKKHDLKQAKKRKAVKTVTKQAESAASQQAFPVFGRPLEQLIEAQQTIQPGLYIPSFFEGAIKCVIQRLDNPGLFRASGTPALIEQMKAAADKGERINFSKAEDVHAVCALIRQYLRELPEPVVPESFTEAFVGAVEPKVELDRLRDAVDALPLPNKALLRTLLHLLWQVNINSSVTEIHAHQLCMWFAPLLLGKRPLPATVGVPTGVAGAPLSSLSAGSGSFTSPSVSAKTNYGKTGHDLVTLVLIQEYEFVFSYYNAQENRQKIEEGPIFEQKVIAHHRSIQCLELMEINDVQYVVSACSSEVRIWETEGATIVKEHITAENHGYILRIAIAGTDIWAGTEAYVLVIPAMGQKVKTLIPKGASALCAVEDHIWANTLDNSTTIRVFDPKDASLVRSFTLKDKEPIYQFACIKGMVWGGSLSGAIYQIDLQGNITKEIGLIHRRKINAIIDVDPYIWMGGDDGLVTVWNKDTAELVRKFDSHGGKVKALALHDSKVWCCTWDMSIKIYNAQSFASLQEIRDYHLDCVSGIVFTENKKKGEWQAWSSSYDKSLNIYMVTQKNVDAAMALKQPSRLIGANRGTAFLARGRSRPSLSDAAANAPTSSSVPPSSSLTATSASQAAPQIGSGGSSFSAFRPPGVLQRLGSGGSSSFSSAEPRRSSAWIGTSPLTRETKEVKEGKQGDTSNTFVPISYSSPAGSPAPSPSHAQTPSPPINSSPGQRRGAPTPTNVTPAQAAGSAMPVTTGRSPSPLSASSAGSRSRSSSSPSPVSGRASPPKDSSPGSSFSVSSTSSSVSTASNTTTTSSKDNAAATSHTGSSTPTPTTVTVTPQPYIPVGIPGTLPSMPTTGLKYKDADFLFGLISRQDAEELLATKSVDVFMIRKSSVPNSYVLSAFQPLRNKYLHSVISTTSSGRLEVKDSLSKDRSYASLCEIAESSPEVTMRGLVPFNLAE